MWPPDFTKFGLFIKPLFETFQMAILGTFLGAIMSIPLVCFGSPLVVKSPLIYTPTRVLMNLIRTIPDLLYAILFVAAMGLGPIAGIPALAFFSCAIISKLTSESADNINRKQIEAVESSGANTIKIISYGVIPQIWSAFLDHTIYVFELNIRVSTVIAYVGAGGIGSVLVTALEWFHYSQALAVIITIFSLVVIIDFVGNKIRDAVLQGYRFPRSFKYLTIIFILTLVIWSGSALEFDFQRFIKGIGYFKNLVWVMISEPELQILSLAFGQMLESIQIALVGTAISFVISFPLGLLASRKFTGIPEKLAILFKQIPNIIRAFPELILAIFFIASFGPGALAGVLAVGFHSIGMLGKLNAESVEKIRKEQIEALQSTGASGLKIFLYGILPQALPEFIANAIYRFEINVRAASVLGIVGAGGIGMLINEAIGLSKWRTVGTCLYLIVITVMVIDYLSMRIRKKLIEG